MKERVYSAPHVGYALTISAMLEPRVKHIVAPMIQHHTTYVQWIQVAVHWHIINA